MTHLQDWEINAGASPEDIARVNAEFGGQLPAAYLRFIALHDGGEGFVGDNFLVLFRIGELAQFNREYEVADYAPGLLLFGSSGGGEGFAFDTREPGWPIVQVPFIGMALDVALDVAPTFEGLFEVLADD
ncbi:SMI1/KNR4 family protein [Mitsuaria sp. 7]|uniref:SMI1/KNR4 family protein n=1 Tax=Mitsuaria sp. 7 TaxID=1658665 RepID=UPI0009EEC7DC|nr:SMI1/KNR4 family protein [Mitsuaria sp. 7]